LLDRPGVDFDPPCGHRSEEVRVVVDPDGGEPEFSGRSRGADAGGAFDRGGEDAPMNDPRG
jgi:hypothetical protein